MQSAPNVSLLANIILATVTHFNHALALCDKNVVYAYLRFCHPFAISSLKK